MRITGGVYGGRRIRCPPGIIRPAMDRMRESVFAILGNLRGLSFLDLYSGSGIVGIEAASRGAEPVVFVELDRKKLPIMRENIGIVESGVKIVPMSAERYLKSIKEKFDITFADPPFSLQSKERILDLSRDAIADDGLLLIHHPSHEAMPEETQFLVLRDLRAYGGSTVSFYGNKTY